MDPRRRMRRVTYTVGRAAPTDAIVGGVNCLAAIPQSGGWVASGGRDGVVRVWRQGTRGQAAPDLQRCFEGHLDWVNDLTAVSPRLLASCSSDSQVMVWDLAEDSCVATISPHFDYVKKLAYSPQLNTLFSGSFDGTIAGIDLDAAAITASTSAAACDAACAYTFAGMYKSVYALATRDALVSVGTSDHSIRTIDWRSGSVISVLDGHKDIVRDMYYLDGDPNILVSCCSDHTMRLWDVRAERVLVSLAVHQSPVWAVAGVPPEMSPKAAVSMISGARDGTVHLTLAGLPGDLMSLSDPKRADSRNVSSTLVAGTPGAPVTALALAAPACGTDDAFDGASLWVASSSFAAPLTVWDVASVLKAPQVRDYAPLLQVPRKQSQGGPQTPPPPPLPLRSEGADAAVTMHHLAHSHIERHTFSLMAPFVRSSSMVKGASATTENEVDKSAAYIAALGPALQRPWSTCRTKPPIVQAKLLDNRRHCLTRDSEGNFELWDLLTGSRCQMPRAVDLQCDEEGRAPSMDVVAEQVVKLCTRVAVASWCTLDVATGSLTVLLDHPSVYGCETWVWEKELVAPNTPAPLPLSREDYTSLRMERPEYNNLGEGVVLGLFRHLLVGLPYRWLHDEGGAPVVPAERRVWRDQNTKISPSRARSPADPLRYVFTGLPESTVLCVWSKRGGFEPNAMRHEPPKGGMKVVFSMGTEPYQAHTRCTVGEVADVFVAAATDAGTGHVRREYSWKIPTWVVETLNRPVQPSPPPPTIRFSLESLRRADLPNLPYDSRVLSGPPRFRVYKIAEKIVEVLKLRLPATGTTPDGRTEYALPEECIVLESDGQELDPLWSLATVDRFYRPKGKDLVIHYKQVRGAGGGGGGAGNGEKAS